MNINPKQYLKKLFDDVLNECSPDRVVRRSVSLKGSLLQTDQWSVDIKDKPVFVLAVGKAAIPMFDGLYSVLEDYISDSLLITSHRDDKHSSEAHKLIVGSHPTPDGQSLAAGKAALSFFEHIPEQALVINLISGGASSLMCKPAGSISLDELNEAFELLLNSGATIYEMNAVRKHCSQIKGGRLLRHLRPEVEVLNLMISDVPQNDLSIIGSGPVTPDASTFEDAYTVLKKYELWEKIPDSIQKHIEDGLAAKADETLRKDEIDGSKHHSEIISSARHFAEAATEKVEGNGIKVELADTAYNDDVETVAENVFQTIRQLSSKNPQKEANSFTLYIFYGESTVQVSGTGKGGRNQELALRAALKIVDQTDSTWLCAGTDGVDGPTDAAGAIIDETTVGDARKKGLDVTEYLKNNDAYHFHKKMGTLLKTGSTGNNLMDIVWVLVENEKR